MSFFRTLHTMTPYVMPTLLLLALVAKPVLSDTVSQPPTWNRNGSSSDKTVSSTTADVFASINTPTVDKEASGVPTILQKEGIPPASVSIQPIKPFPSPTASRKETTSPNSNTSDVECITSTKRPLTSPMSPGPETDSTTLQPHHTSTMEMSNETRNNATSTYHSEYEDRDSSESVDVIFPQTYPTSNPAASAPRYPQIFPTSLTTTTTQKSMVTTTNVAATTMKTITSSSETDSNTPMVPSQPSPTMIMEMHHTLPNETRNIANSTYPSRSENRGSSVGVTLPQTYPTSNPAASAPRYPPVYPTSLTTTTTQNTMVTTRNVAATTMKTITSSSGTDSNTPMVPSQPSSTMIMETHHTLPNETRNIANSTYPSRSENRASSVGVTLPQTYPTANTETTYTPKTPSMSGTSALIYPPKTYSTTLTATTTPRSMLTNSVSQERTTETIKSNVAFVISPTVPTSSSVTNYTSPTSTGLPKCHLCFNFTTTNKETASFTVTNSTTPLATAVPEMSNPSSRTMLATSTSMARSNGIDSIFSTTVTSTVTKSASQEKTDAPPMSRSTPTQETASLTTMLHGTITPDKGRTTPDIAGISIPGTTMSTESTVLASTGTGLVVLRLKLESSAIYPFTTQAILKLICSMLVQQLSAKNTTVRWGTQRSLRNCDTFLDSAP